MLTFLKQEQAMFGLDKMTNISCISLLYIIANSIKILDKQNTSHLLGLWEILMSILHYLRK